MNSINLLPNIETKTKYIYKELTAHLYKVENDYSDHALYLITKQDDTKKFELKYNYHPAKRVYKLAIAIVGVGSAKLTEGDLYFETYYNEPKGKPLTVKEGVFIGRCRRILLGNIKGDTFTKEYLRAVAKEFAYTPNSLLNTPILVGYEISITDGVMSEKVVFNDDGTIHCMTKIQYQNAINSDNE